MNSFQIRTAIHFGPDALDWLRTLKSRHVFIVADPFVVKSGAISAVTGRLEGAGIPSTIFAEVVPDPPIETVAAGVKSMMSVPVDTMIAIGGGSALDTAKLIREFASNLSSSSARPRLVAIPTTSGTGSEVTSFAIVTDTAAHSKVTLVDDSLLPEDAVLDVDLVKTVPPALVADTGLDVLTHAMEALVSPQHNDFTDALAQKAIELVGSYLLRSYADANDLRARAKMHSASTLAGMAFNAASLGLNHGIAHTLGGHFHIPHGRANALALPAVIAFNAGLGALSERPESTHALRAYAACARLLGLQANCPATAARALIRWVEFMKQEMKVPASVSQTGACTESEYRAAIPEMVEAALKDRCTAGNPRPATPEQVGNILAAIW